MKKYYYLFVFIFQLSLSQAQAPAIQWQRAYGGSNLDQIWDVVVTTDGGYIFGGSTSSNDGDLTTDHSSGDAWLIKTDNQGAIQWQKTYGGSSHEGIGKLIQTLDGGYIFAGGSSSSDGDCIGQHGNGDIWVVKTDNLGNVQWTKMLGGSEIEDFFDMKQTQDGGYIIAGANRSTNGDCTSHLGNGDYWIVKLNSSGVIQWQKSYGGSSEDLAMSVIQTADGNYIVTGYTQSDDGDLTENNLSIYWWILKLDSVGNIMWQRTIGGTNMDFAYDTIELNDGSIMIYGDTSSNDGDFAGNIGQWYTCLVKLNADGQTIWQKYYGGPGGNYSRKVTALNDGGFLLLACTSSSHGDVTSNNGMEDFWLTKVTSMGIVQWQKNYGGSNDDHVSNLRLTSDGGCIIVGITESSNGDVIGSHGLTDGWVIKVGPGGPNFPVTPNYVSLQSPAASVSQAGEAVTIHGQVYVAGLTDVAPNISGQAPGIQAWVGLSPHESNTNPASWSNWTVASHVANFVGNNDEYSGSVTGLIPGTYYYATRFLLNDGSFVYGGIGTDGIGGIWNGTTFGSGTLTVNQPSNSLAGIYNVMVERFGTTPGQYFFDNEVVNLTSYDEYRTTTVGNYYPASGTPGSTGTLPLTFGVPGYTFTKIGDHFEVTQEMLFQLYGNNIYQFPEQLQATSYNATTGVMIVEYSISFSGVYIPYRNTYNPVSLGVKSNDVAKITFFPNPVKDKVSILNISEDSTVMIYNLLGQDVTPHNFKLQQGIFDLSNLQKGTYILKIVSEGVFKSIKILKE